MAENEQKQMTYQDAYDSLIQNIYAPVFFDKLASDFGIQPTSPDEAKEYLVLAGKLQQLDEANQVKSSNDRKSFVAKANQSLDKALGYTVTEQRNDQEVKEAAVKLAQVQHIRDAALLYQDAMRQMLAQ